MSDSLQDNKITTNGNDPTQDQPISAGSDDVNPKLNAKKIPKRIPKKTATSKNQPYFLDSLIGSVSKQGSSLKRTRQSDNSVDLNPTVSSNDNSIGNNDINGNENEHSSKVDGLVDNNEPKRSTIVFDDLYDLAPRVPSYRKNKEDDEEDATGSSAGDDKSQDTIAQPPLKRKKKGESILRVKSSNIDRATIPKCSGNRVKFRKDSELVAVKLIEPANYNLPLSDDESLDTEDSEHSEIINEHMDTLSPVSRDRARMHEKSEAVAAFKSDDNKIIPTIPWRAPPPILLKENVEYGKDTKELKRWESAERTRPPLRSNIPPDSPVESNNLKLKLNNKNLVFPEPQAMIWLPPPQPPSLLDAFGQADVNVALALNALLASQMGGQQL